MAGLVLSLIGVIMLAGCNVRPLYAELPAGKSFSDELAAVAIDPVSGRFPQAVRNELIFDLTGGAGFADPEYRLILKVTQQKVTGAIDPVTARPTTTLLNARANFTLIPAGQTEPGLTGVSFANVSFDRGEQRFAILRAEQDAENRAATLLANDIKTQIANYVANRQTSLATQ